MKIKVIKLNFKLNLEEEKKHWNNADHSGQSGISWHSDQESHVSQDGYSTTTSTELFTKSEK